MSHIRNIPPAPPGYEMPPGIDPDVALFLGDPRNLSMMSFTRYLWPVAMAGMGLATAATTNAITRRPWNAGIHRHFLFTLIGAGLGYWLFQKKEMMHAEKDFQYYHYMITHPEDFPAPQRVKFRDYLSRWDPVR